MEITGNDQEYKRDDEPSITIRELMEHIEGAVTANIRYALGKHCAPDYSRGMTQGAFNEIFSLLWRLDIITSSQFIAVDIEKCFDDSGVNK